MKVRIKKLNEKAVMPKKAHPSDAGFDLVATSREIDEYGNIVYGTGIAIEIPEGYVGYAFPRSSISKYDLVMANSTGVIDSHFRGEMKFKFRPALMTRSFDALEEDSAYNGDIANWSEDNDSGFVPCVGARIAQLIIMPIPEIDFEEAEELTATDRGTGGYGSTGK